YRTVWQTRGLDTDGWLLADRPATLRVYSAAGDARLFRLQVVLAAPESAPARFVVGTQQGEAAANAVTSETVDVCVPAHSHADVSLRGLSSASIQAAPLAFDVTAKRRVTAHVGPISARVTRSGCT